MMTPNPHPGPQQPQPAPPGPEGAPPTSSPFSSFIVHPSSFDNPLLSALFDPSQSLLATAAAHNLSLLDVARWFAQPHIQAQVEQIQALRALDHQAWAEQCRHEAAEALRQAMREATDPAERRRCASTLLRAIAPPRPVPRAARPPVPAGTSATSGRREPAASVPHATEPPTGANVPPDAPPHAEDSAASSATNEPAAPPSVAPSLRPSVPSYEAALATLRELGFDTAEDQLTDDELDALEDAQLDADLDADLDDELDAELDEELDLFYDDLTEADLARVEALIAHHRAHHSVQHHATAHTPAAPDTS